MLTRRQALQAILAAPAFRLMPVAPAPAAALIRWPYEVVFTTPCAMTVVSQTFKLTTDEEGFTHLELVEC